MIDQQIQEDFKKLKQYLKIPEDYRIELVEDSAEGFCSKRRHVIRLGILSGYKRWLLVHECLHAAGLSHYKPAGYEPIERYDTYSKMIEAQVFGNVEGDLK